MKSVQHPFLFLIGCLVLWLIPGTAIGDPMGELMDEYQQDFKAVVPEPYSSVNSDYKLEQIAMGGLYITKSLSILFDQNRVMAARQEEMIRKYDQMIEQNREIIRLLNRIAKQGQPVSPGQQGVAQ
ncbi:MAG: hypothetical protein ACOC23_01055 [Thermodesulfobacteriota bacterium]